MQSRECEVAQFRAVGGDIKEFPWRTPVGDEFPVAGHHRAMIEQVKVERLVRRARLAGEDRAQALAGQRGDGLAFKLLRPAPARDIDQGRHHVDEVRALIGGGAARL